MRTFMPAIYSKFQTVKAIRQALKDAPKQEAGSKEAFEHKVFEVCEGGGPVACLSELYEYAGITSLVILTRDNETVTVVRMSDGTWKANPY